MLKYATKTANIQQITKHEKAL